jgi:hypothetical protein
MNVVQAIQFYINNMVSNIQGMKVFLLDKETVIFVLQCNSDQTTIIDMITA